MSRGASLRGTKFLILALHGNSYELYICSPTRQIAVVEVPHSCPANLA
jgi:hypothetical protein